MEFNLSEKIFKTTDYYDQVKAVHIEDVKEFIKRLKQHLTDSYPHDLSIESICKEFYIRVIEPIDKLAGDKLK